MAKKELDPVSFRKDLIQAITKAFREEQSTERALQILEKLSLAKPIKEHMQDAAEIESVVTELLYGLYYGDIEQWLLQGPKELLEFYVIQVVAEKASTATLRTILTALTLDKKVRLLSFALSFIREGSTKLLNTLSHLHANTPLQTLIFWLRRNYFSRDALANMLKSVSIDDENALKKLIQKLQGGAQEQTETIHTLLYELVDMMLAAYMRTFSAAQVSQRDTKRMLTGQQLEYQKYLQEQLRTFLDRKYTLEEFQNFAHLFGLHGYSPLFISGNIEGDSLLSKVILLHRIFSFRVYVLQMRREDSYEAYSFIFSLLGRLEAAIDRPSYFKEGLALFTPTIATCGKTLAHTPALVSLLGGYNSLLEFLQQRYKEPLPLKNYPIFVFDQSDDELFRKNRSYIDKLNQLYDSSIIHISKNEALHLAKKIGIEGFINTTKRDELGFGGARNCQFLLTGVLKTLFRQKRSPDQVDPKELTQAFNEQTLGGQASNRAGDTLFLLDDDIEVPAPNIFSAALFSRKFQNDYVASEGYLIGRYTKFGLRFVDLQELLEQPERVRVFPRWYDFPLTASISEHLGKPRICLNIPHPSEERHLGIPAKLHAILVYATHQSGSRYPTSTLPTHFFVGLQEYLKGYLPYVIQIMMSSGLLDTLNRLGRLALPWNDFSQIGSFSSLREVFQYIKKSSTQHDLIDRFIQNLHACFDARQIDIPFTGAIRQLIDLDISESMNAFQQNEKLTPQEQESLQKLASLYAALQEDARLLWHYGTKLVSLTNSSKDLAAGIEPLTQQLLGNKNLQDYPLTESLSLMASSLLKGEFNQYITSILYRKF